MNPMVANLEKLLAGGKDGALLRYTLGKAYTDEELWAQALAHLQQAVAQDANYSVAWKQLGKVQLALDDAAGARDAWNKGLACAEAKGDAQVVKELQVFLKRLDKQQAAS